MERSELSADVTLTPVAEPDFAVLRVLAGTIWRQHYAGIISVDRMEDPHDNAVKATRAWQEKFPDLYRYDPTPIPKALWSVARRCHVVSKDEEGWKFGGQRQ